VYGRRTAGIAGALALCAALLAPAAPAAPAATREPLRDARASSGDPGRAFDSAVRPRPAALQAMVRQSSRRFASAANEFQISSDGYGPAAVESVAATLRSLDHGPELARLDVFVATPEEIRRSCGATVVACYVPADEEMVVSGVDRPVAGVPRDFAIAHEYGHHIANSQSAVDRMRLGGASASSVSSLQIGTLRWATYERVCQLTRRGRLFPGDQGAHYWENPEEAFAQSYARLNRPDAGVSWQYTPLLQPTGAALAKIHADVVRPWSGPAEDEWSAGVAAPPSSSGTAAEVRAGQVALGPGKVVGESPWVATHGIRTPLDGPVSVSVRAADGAPLALALRDAEHDRVLARTATDAAGEAHLSYSNCGHASLRLEVRATSSAATFRAAIARP